jgi:hypothetical protein
MADLRLSGFRAVRVTSYWRPGQNAPSEAELGVLRNVADAGLQNGVTVYVTVMSPGSATTPLTDEARADFAAYAATIARGIPSLENLIVCNEPNLNRFWLPQFNVDGSSAAPAAYLALLAETYDAVKAVSPDVRIYGGAVSPRGTDRPNGIRPTHSPTTFIEGLGVAYRASGRTRPVMDALAIHPYMDNSSQPPTTTHPLGTNITIADYDKLVALLRDAFDGTAQKGSDLRSSTASSGSSRRSRRRSRPSTQATSRQRRSPSASRRRPPITSRRSRSRSASRTSRACCSSSRATSGTAVRGSRGSTTSTGPRRRVERA